VQRTSTTNPAASLQLRTLDGGLGAEVLGLPVADIDDAAFPAIYAAFLAHQLLLFRDQELPQAAQVAFARRFGEVQVHVLDQYHAAAHPELYSLSNLDAEGRPSGKHPDRGTMVWHTDGSWRRATGQATMLYAERIPASGGGTQFADMYAAYEALDPAERGRLGRVRALHNLDFSRTRRHGDDPLTAAQRDAVPAVDHPVVRTHPETGRKCLFLGDHAESIAGMGYAEGRAFIEALNQRIVASARLYAHRWRPGDFVVWDNRCLLHRAEGYDTAHEARVIRRCTVLGDVPY
jgi:taurine dioxygenase